MSALRMLTRCLAIGVLAVGVGVLMFAVSIGEGGPSSRLSDNVLVRSSGVRGNNLPHLMLKTPAPAVKPQARESSRRRRGRGCRYLR
jgi:hypothetical protein